MRIKNFHIALPLRVRVMLLVGGLCVVTAAGLISLWLYLRPVTLTIAVGSSDGDGKKIASTIAGRLATTASSVRLKVEDAGSLRDAAKAVDNGTADLAIVRADVGDLSHARTVAVTARGVVMIVAPRDRRSRVSQSCGAIPLAWSEARSITALSMY